MHTRTLLHTSACLVLSLFLLIQSTLAQPDEIFMQMDYTKPYSGLQDDYVWMERTIYKPIHHERIKNGEIVAWYFYEVQYPGGENAEYNFVTITVFSEFGDMDGETMSMLDLVKIVHPDRTADEVSGLATRNRKLVKSEAFKSAVRFPMSVEEPPSSLLIDYMKVIPTNEAVYEKMEKEIWQPLHLERRDREMISSWGMYELLFPGGTNYPYTYATATGFDHWALMLDSWPEEIWSKVHPDATQARLEARAHEIRDLVSTQIWKLVDYALAATN